MGRVTVNGDMGRGHFPLVASIKGRLHAMEMGSPQCGHGEGSQLMGTRWRGSEGSPQWGHGKGRFPLEASIKDVPTRWRGGSQLMGTWGTVTVNKESLLNCLEGPC